MSYQQCPPLSIQIELTEGCNLGCNFCGLRGIRENGRKPWKPMSQVTASKIVKEIERVGWNSRIIFSMHGEPTLNPKHLSIIRLFRRHLPNAIMSMMTNGWGLAKKWEDAQHQGMIDIIDSYRTAGLNDLIIDSYSTTGGDALLIKNALANVEEAIDFDIQELESGIPLYGRSAKAFRVLFTPPIQQNLAINRHLCNHCGAAAPLDSSYEGKRCARPFREMSFRWDGWVALCCNDFRGEYPISNIHDMSIDEIWQHKRFQAARILLYDKQRTFVPCLGCNALSHRVGLLPDRLGKESLPKPSKGPTQLAMNVHKLQEPLATIFKREWEKE